jgi:uncharacterized repeat protein (TIGR01451 family)
VGSVVVMAAMLGGCFPLQPWQSELVSGNAAGTDAGNAESGGVVRTGSVVFSPDGTKIAFESKASNLGPHDDNGWTDIYLRDLTTGTTTLISANAAGSNSGNFASDSPVFSPDGTKIAFNSQATDLGPTDTNDSQDVYLRDLVTGTTSLVSVNASGTDSARRKESSFPIGGAREPVFSPDGTRIAFSSFATDFGPADTNTVQDLYMRDLVAGTTRLISANAAGTDGGNRTSWGLAFSPDGTKVAITSEATDLGPSVPVTFDGPSFLYLRDLTTNAIQLVSVNAAGTEGLAGWSPSFTPDGLKIVFQSTWTGFGPTDTNDAQDVYLRDLAAGTTTLLSVNAAGTDAGNDFSFDPALSTDGTAVVFTSLASDLAAEGVDLNGRGADAYIRYLATGTTELVSINAEGTHAANHGALAPVLSPDGGKVAFVSEATDLGPADGNGVSDVYVRDLRKGLTTLVSATPDGKTSANGTSQEAISFSPDGDRVAFRSLASNLGPHDTNGAYDVYVATLHGADQSVTGRSTPDPVGHGGELTYHLDVRNSGPDTADDPVVHLLLPEDTELLDASTSAGSCAPTEVDGGRVVVDCGLPALDPDESAAASVRVRVNAPAGSTITALAAIDSPTLDPDTRDNSVSLPTVVT